MEMKENSEMNEANSPLNSKTGGFAYSVTTAVYLVTSLILGLIVSAAHLKKGTDAYIYISYLAAQITLAVGVALTLTLKKLEIKKVFPVKCKPKYYIIALLLIYGLIFGLGFVNDLALKLVKLINPAYEPVQSYLPNLSGGLVVPALLVIAVLPAILEEALFRGVILNSCEQGMGSIRTVFIVGFCFSLFHASPEQTVYQFIAGCAFAFIAVRSGSILPSVVMHFINNALIVILNACGCFDASGSLIISAGGYIALTVTSAVCLIGAILWLTFDKNRPLVKCKKGGVKYFFIYASMGIAVLAVLWICAFAGVG